MQSCPSDEFWTAMAAGQTSAGQSEELLRHAGGCPRCASILADSVRLLSPEANAEDEAEEELNFDALASSRPEWQRRLANTLAAGTPAAIPLRPIEAGARRWPGWLAIAATIVLVAGVGTWLWQKRQQPPLDLLARAYTLHRDFELRLPGAGWAPLRVERGDRKSSLADQPEDILNAASRIGRALAKDGNNPAWLWAKGRLALLESRPDDAIQALQTAADSGSSPELLTELAIAYQQRASQTKSSADSIHAIEFLGRALQDRPDYPVALFNRALIEAGLHQTAPALDDFERFLRVEPAGGWSDEARQRLKDLQTSRTRFLNRPAGQDALRFDEIALDRVLEAGLQNPTASIDLAARLRAGNQDEWLTDLLGLPRTPAVAQSIAVLSRMTSIRLTVESGRYALEKNALDSIIAAAPLAAWRDFEALYRATHARGEFRCSSLAGGWIASLEEHRYFWLEAQALREQGYCSFQDGDMDAAQTFADRSIAVARAHAFPVAMVRSSALTGYVDWRRGEYRKAIDVANTALETILADQLPVARSHEFHALIETVSEDLGWQNAARSAATAMVDIARASGFRDLQFTNTVRLAQLALLCRDPVQSRDLFQHALDYYSSLAPDENRAWAEIGFAEATHDERRLIRFAPELERSKDSITWIPYQRVRAQLAAEHSRLDEAHSRLELVMTWMAQEAPHSGRTRSWQGEFQAVTRQTIDLLLRRHESAEAFAFVQRARALEVRDFTRVATPARASTNNPIEFSFASSAAGLAAWRIDGAHIDFRWASLPTPEIERLSRRLRKLAASPDSSPREIEAVGLRIRKALFGSWLEEEAPDRPVLIQIDDTLANLPFGVLPGARLPLGIEREISITQLALPALRPPSSAHPPIGKVLLIDASRTNPAWAAELPPLAGVERELSSVAAIVSSPVLLKDDQVLPQVISSTRYQERVFHFAGHAVKTGSGVGLLFPTSASPVGLEDLRKAGFRAPPTVVLSACSTGESTDLNAPEANSLAMAFLLEGSGEVFASLWNVDSEATVDFMTGFYRNWRRTGDSGKALQSAMVSLRSSSRYSHPYYWAAFARFIRA